MGVRSIDISREESLMMRGMAIMCIALHNYCHNMWFTVKENESSFSHDRVSLFFHKAVSVSDEWIYDLISFLGWYGVPVFVFLTGFGLVRKYESSGASPMVKHIFLYNNWIKLISLLLPAVLYYIGEDLVTYLMGGGKWYLVDILYKLSALTFLNDALAPWISVTPRVYWYFGLALELYFLYAFTVYRRSAIILLLLTFVSIVLQTAANEGIFGDSTLILWYERQNFIGWMVPFAFGIFYARAETMPDRLVYVMIVAAAILFFPVMTDPLLWQISLICAIILAIVAAKVSSRICYWRDFWIFTGRLSPFIFVAHPIVRDYFFKYLMVTQISGGVLLLAYIMSIMAGAIIYKSVWQYLTPWIRYGMDKVISFSHNPRNPDS